MKRRPSGLITALVLWLSMGPAFAAADAATVVFICDHGNAKSLIAATLFNHEAARRHLPLHAVARGVNPGQAVPASIAQALRGDGYDVSGFTPSPITAADLQAASHIVLLNLDRSAVPGADPHKTDAWAGIPPASTDYPGARDYMAKLIDKLIEKLAGQTHSP